jgi:hypothetical protein
MTHKPLQPSTLTGAIYVALRLQYEHFLACVQAAKERIKP